MKKVNLQDCKTFTMDTDWYFANFNKHPYVQNCLVGSYKENTCIVTVLDPELVPLIVIYCAGHIKPFKTKIQYINTNDGSYVAKDLVKYKCGAVRRFHYTLKDKLKKKTKLVAEYSRNDFLRYHRLWDCEYTLLEYMDTFSDDLRTEHYQEVELLHINSTYIMDLEV